MSEDILPNDLLLLSETEAHLISEGLRIACNRLGEEANFADRMPERPYRQLWQLKGKIDAAISVREKACSDAVDS